MADDVTFQSSTLATPPAGLVIAGDDVSGVLYQRVKLDAGGDGASVPVLAGTGTASSALRVALADSSAVAATQSGSWTVSVTGSVSITDGSGSITVDAPVGTPVFVRLSDGSAAITTLPVSLASVPSHDVTNAGTFAVQAAQSGSWTVAVSGTVAISAAALPLPSGAATAAKQPALGTAGTPSSDVISVQGVSGGTVLPVSDGGGTLTVDGTVAATQSGTWTVTGTGGTFPVTDSGGSLTVDAPVGTPIFVRLSDGASAISTLPVSLASVPSHAVTNAGTFAVQAAGDVAHDAADSGAPLKVGAKATSGQSGATMVAAGDRTDLAADIDGVAISRAVSLSDVLTETVSNTDGTSTALSTFGATASAKNVVTALSVFRTDSGTTLIYIDFRDGTAGSVIFRLPIPAGGGVVLGNGAGVLFKQPTANTALAIDVSAATTTVYVTVTGFKTKA